MHIAVGKEETRGDSIQAVFFAFKPRDQRPIRSVLPRKSGRLKQWLGGLSFCRPKVVRVSN